MSTPDQTMTPRGQDVAACGEREVWRQHYPIDTDREREHNRRAFLRTLVATSGVLATGQLALMAIPSPLAEARWNAAGEVVLAKRYQELAPGESLLFHYPDHHSPCLFIRMDPSLSDGAGFVAYSQKCTHLQCPVVPQPDQDRLYCPCHNGAFDLRTGAPLFGPPQHPLPRVRIRIDAIDGTITATGMERSA